jgi:hypothetical protein
MWHLSSGQLIDLAEGVRPESSTPHLQSCAACRKRLAELRATRSAAASIDVPEPSPLFWDHFSARVHDAVEADGAARASAGGRWSWSPVAAFWTSGALAVIVLALVIVTRGGWPEGPVLAPAGPAAAVVAPIGDALLVSDDPSLSLVADLAEDMDWDAASEAGLTTHVGVDNDAVTDLTDGERRVLNQLLKGELAHRGV